MATRPLSRAPLPTGQPMEGMKEEMLSIYDGLRSIGGAEGASIETLHNRSAIHWIHPYSSKDDAASRVLHCQSVRVWVWVRVRVRNPFNLFHLGWNESLYSVDLAAERWLFFLGPLSCSLWWFMHIGFILISAQRGDAKRGATVFFIIFRLFI